MSDTINGLLYIPDFITIDEEDNLLKYCYDCKEHQWNTALKRRTIHFGHEYNYKASNINKTVDIPPIFQSIIDKIHLKNLSELDFDQIIVNEYTPGQGIAAHIDHTTHFDNTIISLSCGSHCEMVFAEKTNPSNIFKIMLEPRSIVILTDDARYKWTHSIPHRKSDNGRKRTTRVSFTFRKTKK
jgi:alkylated DNA repair dioxygenase AlkB